MPIYSPVDVFEFTPNGRFLVGGDHNGDIIVWDVTKAAEVIRFHHNGIITDIKFHPTDQIMITSSSSNDVKMWSLDTGECIGTTTKDKSPIKKILFIQKGYYFITISKDYIKVWDTSNITMIGCSNLNDVGGGIPETIFYDENNPRFLRCMSIYENIVKIWNADLQVYYIYLEYIML